MTTPFIWKDEFAFLKHSSYVFKSAGPAFSKVSEIAAANGKPYSKIITTTPRHTWAFAA